MKNIIMIIACIAILPTIALAQNKQIEKFYNKYKAQENVTDINLQGWVLSVAAKFADEDSGNILEKITKLRVLVVEDKNIVPTSEYKQLIKDVRRESFEDLIQVNEGKSKVNIMMRESGNKITNVLLLVSGDDEFIMLSLEGNLDWEDLKSLEIDVEGAEHLKKLPKDQPRA